MAFQYIIVDLLFFFLIIASSTRNYTLGDSLDLKIPSLKEEKVSHIRVYWHDIINSSNPTAVRIVPPPSNSSATNFGFVAMIDDPLTKGPSLSSKLLGRAQGFYASADQQEFGLIVAMNFVFTEGKYNGSVITILGRNKVFAQVKEMPIIGGTGMFRFGRGYARARTYYFNQKTGDTIVEEMPVIGGRGLFPFARGYAQLRAHKFDTNTGDATVQYDVHVLHY